jgi:hypothetical protein
MSTNNPYLLIKLPKEHYDIQWTSPKGECIHNIKQNLQEAEEYLTKLRSYNKFIKYPLQ